MPQMAPILWTPMMFMLILLLLCVMSLNYFSSKPSLVSSNKELTMKKMSWSW